MPNNGTTEDKDEDQLSITDDIRGAEYYHGLVPRADIEPLLRKEGDFLVRKTEHTPGMIVLALSVRYGDAIRHFMINQDEDRSFYLEHHHEPSVAALINWYRSTKTPLSASTPARLRRAIERPAWLLNHDSIKLIRKLGEGAFGEVYLAEFTSGAEKMEVATKTMREEATREARLKFMKEARLMRKLLHRNIVRIMGVAVHEQPLMIVMELCPGGSLLNHLRKNKGKLTAAIKLRFATEAAAGLAYLEKQNFMHRDIAARNCLLTDKLELKISDFGMSDERTELTDEKLEKVPVKWLAPETMQHKVYTNKTDVWSYGIMLWEIYAEGAEPYTGLTNIQARAKIVVHNYRMEAPKDTPPFIAKLMTSCWAKEPIDRPGFQKIHTLLKEKKVTEGRHLRTYIVYCNSAGQHCFYPIRTSIFENSFVNVPSTCYYVGAGVKNYPTFTSLTALVCYYSTYIYMKINVDSFEPSYRTEMTKKNLLGI